MSTPCAKCPPETLALTQLDELGFDRVGHAGAERIADELRGHGPSGEAEDQDKPLVPPTLTNGSDIPRRGTGETFVSSANPHK